ncbi:MAG: hypothetical protein H6735_06575 [Alphaproteobacteria bacterium]|nr:hypothetical protein [Alphaproteobacteria bacterium]
MLPQLLLAGCAAPPNGLGRPNRLAVGADAVYVSDFEHDRIVQTRADGTFVRTFGGRGLGTNQLWRVTAMVVDEDGSLLVANRRPESDAEDSATVVEVKRFVDGAEVERVDLGGKVLQDDAWLDAIAPMDDGRWLLADSAHGELMVVQEGRLVGRFGGIPRPDAAPTALVREGMVFWEVEQMRHRITPLDSHGQALRFEPSEDVGELRFPSAIGVCEAQGWVAIADFGNLRVVRVTTEGGLLSSFAPTPAGPDRPVQLLDLAVSEDCSRLYLVDSKGDRVLITDPDGAVLGQISTW